MAHGERIGSHVQTTHSYRTTHLPLATIAYMVGFNDVSNFRRAYIKWTGQTPRETRNVQ